MAITSHWPSRSLVSPMTLCFDKELAVSPDHLGPFTHTQTN